MKNTLLSILAIVSIGGILGLYVYLNIRLWEWWHPKR
jgi:hypothetical protein